MTKRVDTRIIEKKYTKTTMTKKLTFHSDEELMRKIKEYAKKHNTSVSRLVNDYFKELGRKEGRSLSDELYGVLEGSGLVKRIISAM